MADTKISALTELTTDVADNDELAVVDTSASATKKVDVGYVRRFDYDAVTVTGSLTAISRQIITLASGSNIALTISGAPTIGDELIIYAINNGAGSHTVILSGSVTFDGTNETATFNAAGDAIHAVAISTTRWLVVYNNSVTFS